MREAQIYIKKHYKTKKIHLVRGGGLSSLNWGSFRGGVSLTSVSSTQRHLRIRVRYVIKSTTSDLMAI